MLVKVVERVGLVKFIMPILLGAAVCFILFAIMASLVNQPEIFKEEADEDTLVNMVTMPKDSEVVRRKRQLEPPAPPAEKPTGMVSLDTKPESAVTEVVKVDMPDIDINTRLEPQQFSLSPLTDNSATPIYRSLPIYPIEAARAKIKGWVDLRFTVNQAGKIEDIEILESEPAEVFDQAAIDALKRWKYKAKIVDGKAVRQEGLSVRINFGKNNTN